MGRALLVFPQRINKTELVLVYAYRFSQTYQKILWLGGENRYIHQNYLNFHNFLKLISVWNITPMRKEMLGVLRSSEMSLLKSGKSSDKTSPS